MTLSYQVRCALMATSACIASSAVAAPLAFLEPERLDLGLHVRQVLAIDFDGDGHEEVALYGDVLDGPAPHRVVVLGSTATGSLSPMWSHDLTARPTGLAAIDFDRDSLLDLVVSTQHPWPPDAGAAEEVGLLVFVNTGTTDQELFSREPATFEPDDGSMFTAPVQVLDQSVVWMRAFGESDHFDLAIAQLIGNNSWLRAITFGPGGAVEITISNVRANEFALGDFDGDGDLDVIARANEGRVVWNMGQELVEGPLLDFTPRIFETEYRDLNGDGLADLIESPTISDQMIVRASDGAGGFVAETSILGFEARPTQAMDVDGDNTTDLVAANLGSYNSGISIYYGDEAAGFSSPQSFDTLRAAPSLAAVRLRGDTHTDFVVPTLSGVEIIKGRPNRRFAAPAQLLGVYSSLFRVAIGDLTNDGLAEIGMAISDGQGPRVGLFQNTNGRFELAQSIAPPSVEGGVFFPVGVTFLDVDGDGDLDLACNVEFVDGGANSGSVWIFLYTNEDGHFQPFSSFEVENAYSHADLRAIDATGDGVLDLIANVSSPLAANAPSGLTVVPGDESGLISPPISTYVSPPNWFTRRFEHFTDFNDDGVLDVLVGAPYFIHTMPSVLFLGAGGGAFDDGLALDIEVARPRAVIDANADGVPDIIGPLQGPPLLVESGAHFSQLGVHYGAGVAQFKPVAPFTKLDILEFTCATTLDLSGDEVEEFLVSGQSSHTLQVNEISIFQAGPQLSSIPAVQLRQSSLVTEAYAADVDGDGDLDLITYGYSAVTIHESTLADRAADFDSNGVVDSADLALLLSAWGTALLPQDLNQDGVVDGADLGHLLAQWGSP